MPHHDTPLDRRIATASYRTAPRSGLTIVQTSVGSPKWLQPLPQLGSAKPWGLFDQGLAPDEFADRYTQRLGDNWDRVERDLERLLAEHGGIALCCWCSDPATCHRSILADHITHMLGVDVPEFRSSITDLSTAAQLRLEGC